MTDTAPPPLSGRRAQAARNDELILASARAVFVADPSAPITDVAKHAGVGISALYSRYGSKDELLRVLCRDGLQRVIDIDEAALADDREPWPAFENWVQRLVAADSSSLTNALAGKFTPSEDLYVLAERANQLGNEFFERVRHVLRPGIEVHDVSVILEIMAAVKVADHDRAMLLRQRYLALLLDGLRAGSHGPLPGPGPTWQEISGRWAPQ